MERYPDVDVIFRDGTLEDLTRMYREGNVDFMISIFRDELPDAVYQEIAMEQVLVALPDTHPAIQYAYSVEGDRFLHLDMLPSGPGDLYRSDAESEHAQDRKPYPGAGPYPAWADCGGLATST